GATATGGNAHAQPLGGNTSRVNGHFAGSNPYHRAEATACGPAAVPGIDCGIGLHQILVLGFINGDVAFDCAQHAPADGTAVANSIAHYHDGLTEQVRRNIIEIDEGEIGLRVDFDERQIGIVVAGNVMRAVCFPVVSRYVNLQIRRTLYHVLVRHDVTGWIYDKTRSQALQRLTDFARPKPVVAKELRIKLVDRIAHSAPNDALGIDIH